MNETDKDTHEQEEIDAVKGGLLLGRVSMIHHPNTQKAIEKVNKRDAIGFHITTIIGFIGVVLSFLGVIPERYTTLLVSLGCVFYILFRHIRIFFMYYCYRAYSFRVFELYSQKIGVFITMPLTLISLILASFRVSVSLSVFYSPTAYKGIMIAFIIMELYIYYLSSHDKDFIPLWKN